MEYVAIIIGVLGVIFVIKSLIKISPYEKWIKERFSRYVWTLDSGWHFIVPFIDSVRKVDMRERVINTQPHEMITRDNAVVTVDAVIFAQIFDPVKAVYEISNPWVAVQNLAITTLRAIIGTMTLDEVLGERSKINAKVQTEISHETAKWWISITKIEIQRIDPPTELMEAMNKQKIAQQEKRAAILKAEGQKEAAIREAEGQKQAQILKAEGEWQAIERIAEAKAKALELEATAAIKYFKDNAVLKEQFRVLQESLKNNTKYVLDSDILSVVKSFFLKK